MQPPTDDKRWLRIEAKLDAIADEVRKIGIIEERLANNQAGMERLGGRIDVLDDRLRDVELRSSRSNGVMEWIKSLFMMALAAALGVKFGGEN